MASRKKFVEDFGNVAKKHAAGDQAQTLWDTLLDVDADAYAVTMKELSDWEIVCVAVGHEDCDEYTLRSLMFLNLKYQHPRKHWMQQTCCSASWVLTMTRTVSK